MAYYIKPILSLGDSPDEIRISVTLSHWKTNDKKLQLQPRIIEVFLMNYTH